MFSHLILEHKHETLSRVLLARKNSNLGQIPKFYPLMYILQTRRQMLLGKKKFQVIEIRAFTWFFAKGNKKIK